MKSVFTLNQKQGEQDMSLGNGSIRTLLIPLLLAIACCIPMFAQAAKVETVTYYHTDMLGSPVAASNEAGKILWEERYLPYGETELNPEASEANTIGYTGHRKEDYGLVYMQARYYDPIIGRFTGIDPQGFSESNYLTFNRYAYANNNPNSFYDPNGEVANFAIKFVVDVGLNIAINYATTGSAGLGMAFKDSAMDAFNPAATLKKAKKISKLIKAFNKDKVKVAKSGVTLSQAKNALKSGNATDKGGLSQFGKQLEKHMDVNNPKRNPDVWGGGPLKGNNGAKSQTGYDQFRDVFNAQGSFSPKANKNGTVFLEKSLPDGRGVRLNRNGSFKGFID